MRRDSSLSRTSTFLQLCLILPIATQRVFEVLDHGTSDWSSSVSRSGCLLWPSSDVSPLPTAVQVPLLEGNAAVDPSPISGIAQTPAGTVITMDAIPTTEPGTAASPYCWIFAGNPQANVEIQIGPGSGTYSVCNQVPLSPTHPQYATSSTIEYTFINARSSSVLLKGPAFVASSTVTLSAGRATSCYCFGNLFHCES